MNQFTATSQDLRIKMIVAIGAVMLMFALGCTNRAPSLRVLDTRAGYGNELDDEDLVLYQRGRKHPESTLSRNGKLVVTAYIYPHELPTRDYFWGGYVSVVVDGQDLIFENPEDEITPAVKELKKKKT